jgi:hypothetical protein
VGDRFGVRGRGGGCGQLAEASRTQAGPAELQELTLHGRRHRELCAPAASVGRSAAELSTTPLAGSWLGHQLARRYFRVGAAATKPGWSPPPGRRLRAPVGVQAQPASGRTGSGHRRSLTRRFSTKSPGRREPVLPHRMGSSQATENLHGCTSRRPRRTLGVPSPRTCLAMRAHFLHCSRTGFELRPRGRL